MRVDSLIEGALKGGDLALEGEYLGFSLFGIEFFEFFFLVIKILFDF